MLCENRSQVNGNHSQQNIQNYIQLSDKTISVLIIMTHIFTFYFNESLDYYDPNNYRRWRHSRHFKYPCNYRIFKTKQIQTPEKCSLWNQGFQWDQLCRNEKEETKFKFDLLGLHFIQMQRKIIFNCKTGNVFFNNPAEETKYELPIQ